MKKLILTAVCALLWCSTTARADILFNFTGAGNLSGSFFLDDSVPITISSDLVAIGGHLSTPQQTISGNYGAYSFTGTSSLFTFDLFNHDTLLQDFWIVRSALTGPTIGGLSPIGLNLFVYEPAGGVDPYRITPPNPWITPTTFAYTLSFSDGSYVGAPLETLTFSEVPEPSSLALLPLGLIGVVVAGRFRKRSESIDRSVPGRS